MNNIEIGTDIEKIKRFEGVNISKNSNFLKKIFTQRELNYCFSKNDTSTHLAGRYAAKEAVIKALSPIYDNIITYNEVEILNNENGIPEVKISKNRLHELKIKISISHNEDNAIATAIIYN